MIECMNVARCLGVQFADLGLTAYPDAYARQLELVALRQRGEVPDTVLMCEHPHVLTVGRTGKSGNLKVGEDCLKRQGVSVFYVDRGGDITYHGPGQLVMYPVMDLTGRGRDVHVYLRDLEKFLLLLLEGFGLAPQRRDGFTGVWVEGKKIASIGIGIKKWVTYHGIALNVSADLSFFSMINPCGLKGIEMTSLERLSGAAVSMDDVKREARKCFKEVFETAL